MHLLRIIRCVWWRAMSRREADAFSMPWVGQCSSAVAWLTRGVQLLVMVVASVFGLGYGMAALGDSSDAMPGALLLWGVSYYPAMMVHELGHYLGARLAGMAVLRIQLSAVEILPQRRGFRWRWRPLQKQLQVGGYVLAFADPSRPPRQQIIALAAGGPGLNLAVAAVLALVAWIAPPHGVGWWWMVFAAMNAGLGVANLVPRQGKGGFRSDGLILLHALQHRLEISPYMRLISLSVFGCTADRLPADDLALLEAQASPMRLVALWYRVKAHQNRGEWLEAASKKTALDDLVPSLDPAQASLLVGLIACIGTEIAFSQAMLSKDASVLTAPLLPPKVAWEMPALWPRCLALRAALAGDIEQCVASLAVSRRMAENAIDRALPASEQMIRASMSEAFGHAWTEDAIDAKPAA